MWANSPKYDCCQNAMWRPHHIKMHFKDEASNCPIFQPHWYYPLMLYLLVSASKVQEWDRSTVWSPLWDRISENGLIQLTTTWHGLQLCGCTHHSLDIKGNTHTWRQEAHHTQGGEVTRITWQNTLQCNLHVTTSFISLSKKVWNFLFGWPYLCCHLIIKIKSGIIGKLFHFPFQQRPIL